MCTITTMHTDLRLTVADVDSKNHAQCILIFELNNREKSRDGDRSPCPLERISSVLELEVALHIGEKSCCWYVDECIFLV